MGTSRYLDDDWFSWPLPANVELGQRAYLHSSYAFIHYKSRAPVGVRVGHDTGIYHGTFFNLGPNATVEIGNYGTLVGAIFSTDGQVVIGDHALIAHEVVFADSDWPLPGGAANAVLRGKGATAESRIEIGDNVWIGAQAIILANVRIGEGSIVGAATVVTGDVPPYTLCAGNPMRIVRSL
jgi:acetyltransferase-like isoleucine patch superfamily enzyme